MQFVPIRVRRRANAGITIVQQVGDLRGVDIIARSGAATLSERVSSADRKMLAAVKKAADNLNGPMSISNYCDEISITEWHAALQAPRQRQGVEPPGTGVIGSIR